jgi:resuscitation-promoting factor RpfB
MTANAMQVVTVVDGFSLHLGVTDARTVAEALRALEIDRSPLDRIEPELHVPIDGPIVIRVTRVELHERRVEVELPRETVRIQDPALPLGQTRVEQRGHTGLRVDTQLVLTVEGEVETRLTVDRATVRSPLPRIERVGTLLREGDSVWDALARCEASGRWDAVRRVNSRTEYHGGLQFLTRTWNAFRPADFPALASEATREQQIAVGERVLAAQGWRAWPACSRKLGLR